MILDLKLNGYTIIGTKVDYGKNIKDINAKKYAFIVGNEGNGINSEILDLCDEYVYINMNNSCESLNVGIASSIIMYEIDNKKFELR